MKMQNLMIDLETLGTAANAPVLSIGAVFFDPNTGELGEQFDEAINVSDAMRYGVMSGDTFKWWMQQSDAARKAAIRGTHKADYVFDAFWHFVTRHGGANVQPWGNGASFDITILDYAFPRILRKDPPWKFWNVRDCRTIKALAEGIVTYESGLQGTAHNAIDDAIHQAKYVSAYWQGLRRVEPKPVEANPVAQGIDLLV